MKKIYIFTTAFLISIASFTQIPSLNYFNNAWIVGDSYSYYSVDTNAVSSGPSGANVTWNYALLSVDMLSLSNSNFINPSNTPNASSFPTATVALDASGVYQYYKFNSTSGYITGLDLFSMILFNFTDPEQIITYPFTYNSSCSDNFSYAFAYSGVTYNTTGTVNVTGDSWGKLILPNKTFTNVLRTKTEEISTTVTTLYTLNSTAVTYQWFNGVNKAPVFQLNYSQSTRSDQPGVVNYDKSCIISDYAVLGIEETADVKEFSIYPNPVRDFLIIATLSKNAKYELLDLNGKILKSGEIYNYQQKLDCRGFSNGIYFIRLISNNSKITLKKIIINN